ncbi:uncharacterized protein BX664DRAFT_321462 [Halteromyces radiatus]|uniref:uncharacterized protein n=1 Tax=Halteromyces radiatus TaxID=101107 RepID=UPI00221E873E|nr:uncharacterized protein BX664DRAFT_321462 [Halteromyces radiatus]KAI8099514.1 hypothetical protein BX664DRAFT_321462 [Halteromyces radiatus]
MSHNSLMKAIVLMHKCPFCQSTLLVFLYRSIEFFFYFVILYFLLLLLLCWSIQSFLLLSIEGLYLYNLYISTSILYMIIYIFFLL